MVVPATGRDIAAASAGCWWPPPRSSSGADRAAACRQLAGPLDGPDRQRRDRVLAAQAAAILIAQLAAWVIRFLPRRRGRQPARQLAGHPPPRWRPFRVTAARAAASRSTTGADAGESEWLPVHGPASGGTYRPAR